ncbi:hypothetical protein [Streptomyces chartreusis]
MSTNGVLLYGYDLAGGDCDFAVREVGEYGELELDWYDDDGDGFQEQADERLLAAAGFTEVWTPDASENGFYTRRAEALATYGAVFESYCCAECTMYALAAKGSVQTAHRGSCETADFTVQPEWDDRLRNILEVLGLTPTQETARWLLVSWKG